MSIDRSVFPLRDENPTLRTPVVTLLLILANVAAWVFLQGAGTEPSIMASVCELGLIPAELTGNAAGGVELAPGAVCMLDPEPQWWTLVTSMFMHGGWFHLIGNMWFLWVFGNNVEDSMGRARFLAFYLLCGLAAAGAQIAIDADSTIPMVGASGAIGGVMGAYVVLYPRVPVHLLVFLGIFITTIRLPAYMMLGYWFLLQVIGALPQVGGSAGGVAFWAHIGGFAAGVALVWLFRNRSLVDKHRGESGTIHRHERGSWPRGGMQPPHDVWRRW